MSKVISANDLARGTVVFFGADGAWLSDIAKATVYSDTAAAEAALVTAKQDEARAVVDPFIVDSSTDGKPSMTLRDAIRVSGPTIDYLPVARPSAG